MYGGSGWWCDDRNGGDDRRGGGSGSVVVLGMCVHGWTQAKTSYIRRPWQGPGV